jgi:hypothetical protein
MEKQAFLDAVRQLRRKAVEELCRDEQMGRYYTALQKLDELEAKALAAGKAMAAVAVAAGANDD